MKEDSFHLGVKAIIRNSKGEVLLLKTNPQTLKGYSGEPYWDIPGGRIHKGSSVEETLKRELQEETGITSLNSMKPFAMVLSKVRIPVEGGDVGLILSSYICDVGAVQNIEISNEHTEAQWFTPQEASSLLSIKYPVEFVEKLKELK